MGRQVCCSSSARAPQHGTTDPRRMACILRFQHITVILNRMNRIVKNLTSRTSVSKRSLLVDSRKIIRSTSTLTSYQPRRVHAGSERRSILPACAYTIADLFDLHEIAHGILSHLTDTPPDHATPRPRLAPRPARMLDGFQRAREHRL